MKASFLDDSDVSLHKKSTYLNQVTKGAVVGLFLASKNQKNMFMLVPTLKYPEN